MYSSLIFINGMPLRRGESVTIDKVTTVALSADEIAEQRAWIAEYLRTHPHLSEKERKKIDDWLAYLDKVERGEYQVPMSTTFTVVE